MAPEKTYHVFIRSGRRYYYCYFFDPKTGSLWADPSTGRKIPPRSTGKTSEAAALKWAKEEYARLIERGRPATGTSIATYITLFWTNGSDYLTDCAAANKPLSGKYLKTCLLYTKKHIATYPPFQNTPFGEIDFNIIDKFFRSLRQQGISRHVVNRTLDALRKPVSWSAARKICNSVDFRGLTLIAKQERERGLLTDAEVKKILAIPVVAPWKTKSGITHIEVRPRPRAKGNKSAPPTNEIDVRMKGYVLLALFGGLRRGEERGLTWDAFDLDHKEMTIKANYQTEDGMKDPKAKSFGVVPIPPELEVILWELKNAATLLDLDKPTDFVLSNPSNPQKPIAETTLKRAWARTLRSIGISEDEQKKRHLVPHGARHRYVTKLLDAGFSPSEAGKLSRQKTQAIVLKYGAHLTAETVAKAKAALRLTEAQHDEES